MEWWGSEQNPGSVRQLHEKTSWEGQKHLDRCIGGDKWAGGRCVCAHFGPLPVGTSALPSVAPDPLVFSSGFHLSALSLPTMASYQ